jgi:hypothetical protein
MGEGEDGREDIETKNDLMYLIMGTWQGVAMDSLKYR